MSKNIKIAILAVLSLVIGLGCGFLSAKFYAGVQKEYYSLKNADKVYEQPSLEAEQLTRFGSKEKLLIVSRVKLERPTLVKVKGDHAIDHQEGGKILVKDGDILRLEAINEATKVCNLIAGTKDNEEVKFSLPQTELIPIDEGEWVLVKNERNRQGWIQIKSDWH